MSDIIKRWNEWRAENPDEVIDLRGAYLRHADLSRADLYGAYLRGADLRGADLRGAYLRGADLYGADLRGADLYRADLYAADLRGANLYGADLRGAYLYGADLRGADLYGADLRGADLYRADLYAAYGAHALNVDDPRGFHAWLVKSADGLRVIGGCRNYTLTEAREHWGDGYEGDRETANRLLAEIDRVEAEIAAKEQAQ